MFAVALYLAFIFYVPAFLEGRAPYAWQAADDALLLWVEPLLTMFAPGHVDDGEVAQAEANRRVMDAALDEHGARCCGC